jgi:hypothetical protein
LYLGCQKGDGSLHLLLKENGGLLEGGLRQNTLEYCLTRRCVECDTWYRAETRVR